jgi:hypothetical protein
MKTEVTQRGFRRIDFKDIYGGECSLQKSSLATADAIWLGLNTGTHHQGGCMGRMHLDIETAERLIHWLQYFVDHGELPPEHKPLADR